ncbi:MAG: phage holin family protein [Prevotella sp.]|jgi:protein-S-isoprenylcysteine O-methyltransferase Ste14|nr:phage holin family protein [Prevotella sp.]
MQNNNQSNNDLQSYFDQIRKDLSIYLTKRLEWFKLSAYEKTAMAGSYIMYGLLVALLLLGLMFIVLLSLGFLLGAYLGCYAAGFAILAAVVLVILLLFAANAKRFRRFISNKVITVIRKIEKDEE